MSPIEESLQILDFPQGIKNEALVFITNVRLSTGRSTRKGSNRTYLLFVSIYYAYHKMGIVIDTKDISKKLDMQRGEINKAFNKYSEANTGVPIIHRIPNIKSFVVYICNTKYKMPAAYTDEIVEEFNIFEKVSEFKKVNNNPKAYAVGFIKYFVLRKSGRDLKTKELSIDHKISETLINKTFGEITDIYIGHGVSLFILSQ